METELNSAQRSLPGWDAHVPEATQSCQSRISGKFRGFVIAQNTYEAGKTGKVHPQTTHHLPKAPGGRCAERTQMRLSFSLELGDEEFMEMRHCCDIAMLHAPWSRSRKPLPSINSAPASECFLQHALHFLGTCLFAYGELNRARQFSHLPENDIDDINAVTLGQRVA